MLCDQQLSVCFKKKKWSSCLKEISDWAYKIERNKHSSRSSQGNRVCNQSVWKEIKISQDITCSDLLGHDVVWSTIAVLHKNKSLSSCLRTVITRQERKFRGEYCHWRDNNHGGLWLAVDENKQRKTISCHWRVFLSIWKREWTGKYMGMFMLQKDLPCSLQNE